MEGFRYLPDVVTLAYEEEKCVGCGKCEEVCPHGVFVLGEKKKALMEGRDLCMECGACAKNCPAEAISVKPGVGCASAILQGWLTGTEPACGCGSGGGCC